MLKKAIMAVVFLTLPLVTAGDSEIQKDIPQWYDNYALVINRYNAEEFKEGTVTVNKLKEMVSIINDQRWESGLTMDWVVLDEFDYDTDYLIDKLTGFPTYIYFERVHAGHDEESLGYHWDGNHVFSARSALEQQLYVCDSPEYFAIINRNNLCNGKCMGTVDDGTDSCLVKIDIIEESK